MALIEFLGGEETGNVGRLKWGDYTFEINRAVECNDPHIVKKARGNRFFRVDGDDPPIVVKPDRMATARAARAAKRATAAPPPSDGDAA